MVRFREKDFSACVVRDYNQDGESKVKSIVDDSSFIEKLKELNVQFFSFSFQFIVLPVFDL